MELLVATRDKKKLKEIKDFSRDVKVKVAFLVKVICASIPFIILWSNSLLACECVYYGSLESKFSKMDAVFIGKLIKIERSKNDDASDDLTFELVRSYKGIKDKLIVVSYPARTNCGGLLERNKQYLVYASFLNGTLNSSVCTGVEELSEGSHERELEVLNRVAATIPK